MSNETLTSEIPRMREYARFLTRDAARADDLVQDSLARALNAMASRDERQSLRAWLFTIMRNRHIDIIRRNKSAPDNVSMDGTEYALPDSRLEASDFFFDLGKAFAKLPEDLKETMWLVGVQGYSYAETASVQSIPIGTVRSRVFRAREILRGGMSDYFPRVDGKAKGDGDA